MKINFDASAALRKWPSIKSERATALRWPDPYTVIDGTLDECVRAFLAKPSAQRHLYEIHTLPQGDLVTAVMSAEHIDAIAKYRDFL